MGQMGPDASQWAKRNEGNAMKAMLKSTTAILVFMGSMAVLTGAAEARGHKPGKSAVHQVEQSHGGHRGGRGGKGSGTVIVAGDDSVDFFAEGLFFG